MKKYKYITVAIITIVMAAGSSCKKALDINASPNSPTDVPITQLYNGASVNVGFTGGSDLFRYAALISQQLSGQTTGALTQTQQYEQYLITGSDANNLWNSLFTGTLTNLNIIISKAQASGSPHFSGVAKLLEAYTYQCMVDTWGKIPYTEALQQVANINPHYDSDAAIYASLFTLIDAGIADVNQATSTIEVPSGSPLYPGAFCGAKWTKFGNTLKLRMLLHMLKLDPAGTTTKMNALIASGTFFGANADNFSGTFLATPGAQNPIYQFETGSRVGYLVANKTIITLMNNKQDPRRPFFFTDFPVGSGTYVGAVGGATASQNYSHIGTYLKGASGEAPIRMLTFAEYNFIRAEAALRLGVTGSAQAFYSAGITASMTDAGVSAANQATYLTLNGTLVGTPAQQLQQIIEEKFVANFGVVLEPWTDYRRTGYPVITPPANAIFTTVPRSLFYPQSEIDVNANAVQKPDLSVRVFWDVP
jgi:hypothetical protein